MLHLNLLLTNNTLLEKIKRKKGYKWTLKIEIGVKNQGLE